MKKPTIAELEAILTEKDVKVEILPNGEVRVVDSRAAYIAKLEAQVASAEGELANTRFVMDKRGDEVDLLRGNLAAANARADDTSKLLSAVMDEITRVAECALGYKQICSAPQAVRRLADKCKALEAQLARLRAALRELDWHNPLRNDLDAYLHDLARWGLGKVGARPNPAEYGLNILVPADEQPAESERE